MMEKNFFSQNKGYQSPEENWRNNVKRILGENFVDKALGFQELDIEEFKDFNNKIQEFVSSIARDITSSSLRKIYDLIKSSKNTSDLLFTLPYIAYMVGKEDNMRKKNALGKLYVVLKDSIERIKNDEKQVKNIKKFAEALIAYQKFYED
ncbi:MAG: type III-A CRISPR-associated protein Csm2 [Dictyoglomus sp.]